VLYKYIKATLRIKRERKESINKGYIRYNISFNWVRELSANKALKLIATVIIYSYKADLLYFNY
jgi:hypothetical protein